MKSSGTRAGIGGMADALSAAVTSGAAAAAVGRAALAGCCAWLPSAKGGAAVWDDVTDGAATWNDVAALGAAWRSLREIRHEMAGLISRGLNPRASATVGPVAVLVAALSRAIRRRLRELGVDPVGDSETQSARAVAKPYRAGEVPDKVAAGYP